ncbi:hypothetical protein SAMN05421636_102112 [Pricia antarctica]|uniref:Lipocalin-like domain-containing protein n=1 Tax=Pricia antarctica TaxID=641691 RepID=A0A1G6Y6F3_9FLAO|nr:hypothetical protein [Pricia antarctica]SDD85287.1 hypothetical protein SAMN05421636_102112 [Pricia antarctica]
MKSLVVLYMIFGVLVSCSNDDGETNVTLDGKWVLIDAICFACGVGPDFDYSEHTLTFDSKENRVTAENTDDLTFFRSSGSHDFSLSKNQITFDDKSSYIFEIKESTLKLIFIDNPDLIDDETVLTYAKN